MNRAGCQIRTDDPEITNHVLWPTELIRQFFISFQISLERLHFLKRGGKEKDLFSNLQYLN